MTGPMNNGPMDNGPLDTGPMTPGATQGAAGAGRPVRVTYLAAAARWEIAERDAAGTTVLGAYRPGRAADGSAANRLGSGRGTGNDFDAGETGDDSAGIWTGTAADGRIVEVLIDSHSPDGRMSPVAQDLLGRVFGPAVADAVAQMHPEGDVEITLQPAADSAGGIARSGTGSGAGFGTGSDARSGTGLVAGSGTASGALGTRDTVLPGEPGIPTPTATAGRFVVPVSSDDDGRSAGADPVSSDDDGHSAGADPVIDMTVESGRVRLHLPGTASTAGLWVRISAASSGELLGITAVQPATALTPTEGVDPGGAGHVAAAPSTSATGATAEVTIDSQIPVTDLHVQLTRSPLEPVGDRHQRRRVWAEQLLTGIENSAQAGTGTATGTGSDLQHLETAATLAEVLDASDLRQRVLLARARHELVQRRSRQRRVGLIAALLGLGAIGLVLLALLTASGWGPFAAGDTDTPANPGGTGIDGTGIDGTGIVGSALEATPGPMTAEYADGSRARLFMPDAPAEVRAGASIDLRVQATTIDLVGYGYDPATTPAGEEEAGTRSACRSMINREAGDAERQLTPTRFILRLTPLAANGAIQAGGTVIITDGTVPTRAVTISSVREACDTVPYPADGAFFVPSVVERTPFTLSVTVPAELAPGLWQVHLDMPDAPVDASGAVILRVLRP